MLVTVLKAFPYSANGITILHLEPKDPPELVEVRDDLVTGLAAEGFIALEGFAHVAIVETKPADAIAPAEPDEVVTPVAEPLVAPDAADDDADLVEAMTEAELRTFLTKRDGKAPHHKIGPAKLLSMAKGE